MIQTKSSTHNPNRKDAVPLSVPVSQFVSALSERFAQYKRKEYQYQLDASQKQEDFVAEINTAMQQMARRQPIRPDPLHPLTRDAFSKMLTGAVVPTPELLEAMPNVLGVFGDQRTVLLTLGSRAIADDKQRRKAAWLETPEGRAAAFQAQQAKAAEDSRIAQEQEAVRLAQEERIALIVQQQSAEKEQAAALLREQQEREAAVRREQEEARVHARDVAAEATIQAEAAAQIAKQRIDTNKDAWKKNNPKDRPFALSFQEMLEASHEKGQNFGQFLFKTVLPTWKMSQVDFCDHMHRLNKKQKSDAKPTLTDTVLSSWRRAYGIKALRNTKNPTDKGTKPLRDSVDVICRAFGIAPQNGELMAKHEIMLWKAIDGHAFAWKGKKGIEAIDAAIVDSSKTGETGALVKELIEASGIRYERLREALNVQQLSQWMKGAHIEKVEMALQFLQLVNPQPTEELAANGSYTISKQNREILSLLTGRQFDIEKMLQGAEKQGNPGGALFVALTARQGLITLSPHETVVHFNASNLACTEHQVKKMRTGTQLQRGGKISEPYARAIIKMVEGSMQHLVKLGICKPFTPEQKERCVDMLTGVPHPKKMLQASVRGELPIGELVSKSCERLDLNHVGEGSFCEEVGISHMSGFVLGKSYLQAETAEKMATWFVKRYGFTPEEKSKFIALAMGVNLQRTPDVILDGVISGATPRLEGLREIYDYTALSREALAQKAKVGGIIQYSVTEASAGRIAADKSALKRIARACGISEGRINDFVRTYDANQVSRKSSLPPNDDSPTEYWQQQMKNRPATNGWARGRASQDSEQ